jgi:hypothetical protein
VHFGLIFLSFDGHLEDGLGVDSVCDNVREVEVVLIDDSWHNNQRFPRQRNLF